MADLESLSPVEAPVPPSPVSWIDLRSDTVTRPTAAMRRAMAEAEVGDDVYGEDPTIRKLEWRAAELLDKQAAIFVPSGVMGNTIGIKLHTQHGEEIVCESHAHVLDWELSMSAWFSGVFARHVPAPRWRAALAAYPAGASYGFPAQRPHLSGLPGKHPQHGGGHRVAGRGYR